MKQQLLDFLTYMGFDEDGDSISPKHLTIDWSGVSLKTNRLDVETPAEFVDAYLEQLDD